MVQAPGFTHGQYRLTHSVSDSAADSCVGAASSPIGAEPSLLPPVPRRMDGPPHSTRPELALRQLIERLRRLDYQFTTISPASHARVNARRGNARAADLRGVFGWSRPFAPDMLPADVAALMRDAAVVVPAGDGLLRSSLRVSSLGGELLLHSAFPTTDVDAVFFGPDTYRFAAAIEAALAARGAPVHRAADIGCGAGPGAILVGKAHPAAEVAMVDINDAALRLAAVNAAAAGLERAVAVRSDLLSAVPGSFDLIVSNPPYLLDPARRAYRHGGGSLGEGLSVAILDTALERLAPGGTLVLYTGVAIVEGEDAFRAAAERRLRGAHGLAWTYREMDPDVFGEELEGETYGRADRIAAVVLTVTKEGG